MSKLADALSWVSDQRKSYAAETGTLRRGASETASVSMTVGKTMADVEGGNGITVRTNIADFLITAADYQIGGVVVEPRAGDQIDYGGKTYEVMPIAGGESWRYAENINRKSLRVHTKEQGDA